MSVILISSLALAMGSAVNDPVRTCDIATAHPDDPDKTSPGWEREEIDLPAAEAVCREALKLQPERARTAYHLGRAIYYQGRHVEALPYLEQAAAAGYRQAVFVLGYTLTLGGAVPKDNCRAQSLWLRSAALDHPWSAVHLIAKQLDGAFASCKVQMTPVQIDRLLTLAQSSITIEASAGRVEKLAARVAATKASQSK